MRLMFLYLLNHKFQFLLNLDLLLSEEANAAQTDLTLTRA
jgi:hypothetical protein